MRLSASRSIGGRPSAHFTWAWAGAASARRTAGRTRTRGSMARSLARRLRNREEVPLAQIGAAAALERLVVSAQRILLGEIAHHLVLGGGIEHRQGLDLLLLEARQRGADVLVAQQEDVAVAGEVARRSGRHHLGLPVLVQRG